MATCRKCGKNVGCSCNLKDGLCISCRTAEAEMTVSRTIVKPKKNDNTENK